MKIIYNGHKNQNVKRVECPWCRSVLEYEQSDIKIHIPNPNNRFDEYDKYIICEACEKRITVFN